MGHTPGPWQVAPEGKYPRNEIIVTYTTLGDRSRHPDYAYMIACVFEGDLIKNGRANARLIAAAPDLLAACEAQQKLIQEFLDAYEMCALDVDWWDFDADEYQSTLNQGQIVIAKAKGDQCPTTE